MNSQNNAEELLTVDEVADALRIHPVTIRRWVAEKKIPHYRIGNAIRFKLKEVLTYTSQKAEGGAQ